MTLLLLLACVSRPEAEAGAATWAGPGGRVRGCLIHAMTVDLYDCDVTDADGVDHRLQCSPGCVERTDGR